ncbi:MAG: OmpH family outer membrane protein, partial [Bacteroidales bacterium]|nr:OmpH family outer membrane protein [Bacteroidales bacterium]
MKQLKVILSVAVAAIICACNATGNTSTQAANTAEAGATAAQGSIVYIQLDSLINQYDMFNDLRSELENKAQAIQDDLTKKGRSFESAAKDFQTKIEKGLLTRSQAEEQQQRLAERQQNLQNLSQQKQYELAEEEAVMSRRVMDAVQTFLAKYNQEKGYAMIITSSAATNTVIAANPALDITQDVLTGLNNEY